MNRFNKILVAAFMTAAMLLPNMLQAMTFSQFDHMAKQDRQAFLDSLSRDAETALKQEGRSADAQKVHQLFNDVSAGSDLPLGEAELELNLDSERVRAGKKMLEKPNAPLVQVEVALAETLGKNGIKITPDFAKSLMQLTGNFKPTLPRLRLSVGEALSQAQEIRQKKRGVIKDTMGDEEKTVERDIGTEEDECRTSDAILAAAVLLPGSAQAMTFPQFDTMANQDRQDFLDSLSGDAETVLNQEGRSADAQKVHQLFNDVSAGSSLPLGEAELELNLANASVADALRAATQYPNLPQILVAAAMAVTLKNNGIEITPDFAKAFMPLTGTFQPHSPPQQSAPPAAPPPVVSPAPAAAPPADEDQPIFLVVMCVAQNLLEKYSYNNPPAGGKMAAFESITERYIRSVAKPGWEYWIEEAQFENFDAQTAAPEALVSQISPESGRFDTSHPDCPSNYKWYQLPIKR